MGLRQFIKRVLPKTRRGRWRVYVYGTPLILLATDMVVVQCERHIPLGAETTRITAPLGADGYPDYVAWLEAQWSAGVTRENNAAIPLWEIVGTRYDPPQWRDALAKEWGLATGPRNGMFVSFWAYARPLLDKPGRSEEEVGDELGKLAERMRKEPWKRGEIPVVGDWLEANGEALAAFHEAVKRNHYYLPRLRTDGTRPQYLRDWYDQVGMVDPFMAQVVAEALLARVWERIGEGQEAGAQEDLADLYRYCALVMGEEGRAWSVWSPTNLAAMSLANHLGKGDAQRLLDAARGVRASEATEARLEPSRLKELEVLQVAAARGLGAGFQFTTTGRDEEWAPYFTTQPLGTMAALFLPVPYSRMSRDVNRWFDEAESIARLPDGPSQFVAEGRIDREIEHASQAWSPGYRFGMKMSRLRWGIQAADAPGRLTQDFAVLAAALSIYRREHGAYPEELGGVAGIVGSIPPDRWSGQALHYRREGEGYVLYSVGVNGVDDGGKAPKDMVLRVNGSGEVVECNLR